MPSPLRRRNPLRSLAGLAALFLATCVPSKITETPVDVTSFDVNTTAISLNVGESQQVTAVAKSATGVRLTRRTVSYSSSNPSVASVTGTGQVTAVGAGTATITASSGAASTTVSVTVIAKPHLGLSSGALTFNALSGLSSPAAQSIQLSNTGGGSVGTIALGAIQY